MKKGKNASDPAPKKKIGRPCFEPTDYQRKQVTTMAGHGMSLDQIAKIIGIASNTLKLHFRSELDRGLAEATSEVARTLFEQATNPDKPNIAAAIFFLKAKAGWRERDAPVYVKKEDEKTEKAKEAAASGFFATGGKPNLKAVK